MQCQALDFMTKQIMGPYGWGVHFQMNLNLNFDLTAVPGTFLILSLQCKLPLVPAEDLIT